MTKSIIMSNGGIAVLAVSLVENIDPRGPEFTIYQAGKWPAFRWTT
jgi:hypothetical protein